MSEVWVWVDLELTGLDIEIDCIIEIAVLLTDSHCHLIAEGPDLVISASPEALAEMCPFVKEMHEKSGLTQEVLKSSVSLTEATSQVMAFLQTHGVTSGIIAGNSVHCDRHFLLRQMPVLFETALHPYRVVDVTAIKELFLGWRPVTPRFEKAESHRSLEDIKGSVKELEFYLRHLGLSSALDIS
jgi:oligoribonuclease